MMKANRPATDTVAIELDVSTPLILLALSPATEAGTANSISRILSEDASDQEYRPQITV